MNRRRRSELSGIVGILGGVSLFVYVLIKEWYVTTVGHVPLLLGNEVGIVWHLLENVPVTLIGVGLVGSYHYGSDVDVGSVQVGYLVAFLGVGQIFVSHFAEHLLAPIPVPELGVTNLYIWWYYAAWIILATGLTIVGLTSTDSSQMTARQRVLAVWLLPASIVVGLLLSTTVFASISDGFKLPVILMLIILAYNLWRKPEATEFADYAGQSSDRGL